MVRGASIIPRFLTPVNWDWEYGLRSSCLFKLLWKNMMSGSTVNLDLSYKTMEGIETGKTVTGQRAGAQWIIRNLLTICA